MKHLLALPAILRTTALLVSASQHSFSVHDDVLAFPQYEIRFYEEDFLSEDQARMRLATSGKVEELREPEHQLQQRLRNSHKPGFGNEDDGTPTQGEKELADYEQLKLDGHDWLCRVPQIKPPQQQNEGVNETLTKAEEEKELARASDRGWELLSGMQDNCIYFVGGWWSYQFCYNQGVRQFHQLPPSRGIPNWPPVEDPGVLGFMLGTYDDGEEDVVREVEDDHYEKEDGGKGVEKRGGGTSTRPNGELVQRGESRYLTQTLGGGTRCDLTGKQRKIEIQYHCNPLGGERISLIKEMAICTYLMVIQTPRLCNDVAFQPPQKDLPNTISCYPVVKDEDIEDYKRDLEDLREADRLFREEEAAAILAGGFSNDIPLSPPVVGDIIVGGHRILPPGAKLEKSAIVGGGKEVYVDTLASSDGKTSTQEDLKRLGVGDAKAIENLKKQIEKVAGGEAWKLDVIDTPRGREYRGIVGSDEVGEEEGEEGMVKNGKGRKNDKKVLEGKNDKKMAKEDGEAKITKGTGQTKQQQQQSPKTKQKVKTEEKKEEKESQEGSEEEYFKEEL